MSRSVACVSQNKLPKLSQFSRGETATARFAEVASGVDLQQAPQLSEEQIGEDRAKKKTFRGLESFSFESAPFLVLTAFWGRRLLAPTTICSLGASYSRCL